MGKPKIVVLISGFGSNLQALIDGSLSGVLPADISLVVSNKSAAYGLERAKNANIPTLTFPLKPYKDAGKSRLEYDVDLADRIHKEFIALNPEKQTPDLIVLAGWMHILSADFINKFNDGHIINLHPALPGAFDGAHAIDRAYAAFKEGKIKNTGVMVHRVIPEVDRGQVILVREVEILESDTLEALEERIHSVEHGLIVEGAKAALLA
jgi:phosphoribosylglycinamide formyltransferase